MDDNIIKQRKELCFFPILVEKLNHVMPNREFYIAYTGATTNHKIESPSQRYLAVLRQEGREFLGIKRYYRKIGNEADCVATNEQVYFKAIDFLQELGSRDIWHINMSLNNLCNKFNMSVYGVRLKNYFEAIGKNEDIWTNRLGNYSIEKVFEAIKEDRHFTDFLKKEYEMKFICVHAKNGYDLRDHPHLNLGLFYDKTETDGTFQFTHLLSEKIGLNYNYFPLSRSFHISLINHIKEAFVLHETKLEPEYFLPLVFDIKKIQVNVSKLESDSDSLKEARIWLEKSNEFIKGKTVFSYYDLMILLVMQSHTYSTYLMNGDYVKSENIFKKDRMLNREADYILKKCVLDTNERHQYEDGCLKRFEAILVVLNSAT